MPLQGGHCVERRGGLTKRSSPKRSKLGTTNTTFFPLVASLASCSVAKSKSAGAFQSVGSPAAARHTLSSRPLGGTPASADRQSATRRFHIDASTRDGDDRSHGTMHGRHFD